MISVIIPTLNEERALPGTLAAVLAQSCDWEVIVVDGGSDDDTERVVDEHRGRLSALVWLVSERGRARQLNRGAAEAAGDWLLFLHADTRLPEGALTSIVDLPDRVRAGCFRQRFGSDSRLLQVLSWFHNRRFSVTHIAYGDQAMFVERRLFWELGGFPDRPMEDIAFGLKLRVVTRPRMLPLTVVTDARKFDQMGHWRALGSAIGLLIRFRLGGDVEKDAFFDDYR